MKTYTVEEPKFSESLPITETTDTSHADNINAGPKQAFENTLYLKAAKVDGDGGDVSNTEIKTAEDISDEFPIPDAGDSSKTFLGKTKKFFGDVKNWMTGVCLLGQIVNNCVTDNPNLPLSAAQGKALQDALTKLNGELSWKSFANGVSSVDISSLSWKAIHVFIIVNSNNHVTFSIPLVYPLVRASGNEFRFYNFGMYFNSGTYVGGRIGVSIQRIYIDSVLLNGQEVKESSHMWVSYR